MFVKLTRSGGRRYLQLVESYRNDAGQPRQRTVATVGRLDEAGGAVDTLIDRLLAATGRQAGAAATAVPPSAHDIRFDASLAYMPNVAKGKLTLQMNILNVFDTDTVTEFNEVTDYSRGTNQRNPNYGLPTSFQTPRSVSFTARYEF